jgi:hypothetical protein
MTTKTKTKTKTKTETKTKHPRITASFFCNGMPFDGGVTGAGYLFKTDDGLIHAFEVNGRAVGIFDDFKAAARALPEMDPVVASDAFRNDWMRLS